MSAAPRRPIAHPDRTPLVGVVLLVLTALAYAAAPGLSFVAIDDPQYVYDNAQVRAGLTWPGLIWAFTTGTEANWHPLTWLSHMLDVELFGLWAGGHHLTNVALHLVSTWVLLRVLSRTTGALIPSAFVAAVFALHPLHVESVAWVAERKDVLSACLGLLATSAYVRYAAGPTPGRLVRVAVLLALGLLAKPMIVTLPFVWLLLDRWPLARVGAGAPLSAWWPRVREKLPLFALCAASSVITFLVQRAGGAMKIAEVFPLDLRLQNAVVAVAVYLRQAIWPVGLGVFYPLPATIPTAEVVVAAIIVGVLSIAALASWRRAPYATVGWGWFLGMLVPVLGLVQVGAQAHADRYMYLPLVGLTVALAWSADALVRHPLARRALAAGAVAAVLAGAALTFLQVERWRDTLTLWSHTARVTDHLNNFGVHFAIGEHLLVIGRPTEAAASYAAAIQKRPSYAPAHRGLGLAREAAGDRAGAALALADAVRLAPEDIDVRHRLAVVLAQLGRHDDAVREFDEAVKRAPSNGRLRGDFAFVLAMMGRVDDALAESTRAVRLQPDFPEAHNTLGWALTAKQRLPEAVDHLTTATRLKPDFEQAHFNLAVALALSGRSGDALRSFQNVLRLNPGNTRAREAVDGLTRGGGR